MSDNSRLPPGTYEGDPLAPWNQHEDDKPRFDRTQIENWLGSDNHQLEEAIEVITAIANEEYSVKNLIDDLEEMFGKE